MKLDWIAFTFENCETIKIDGKYVGDFECSKLNKKISRVAVNAIKERKICDFFAIEISKTANELYDCFGNPSEETIFNRIVKHNDLVGVDFSIDNKHKAYYFSWKDGENQYTNKKQVSFISGCDNLYIIVSKKKKKRDIIKFFGEQINHEDSMRLHFKLMQVPNYDRETFKKETE